MNNKIIYGIILLCIVCIILVSVISTGHKVLDIFLVVISGIGIFASGVYLKRKNLDKNKREEEERQRKQREEEERQRKQREEEERQRKQREEEERQRKQREEEERQRKQREEEERQIKQREEDLEKERKIKQIEILNIIKENENENDIDKISGLIIYSMFNAIFKDNFFNHFQSEYLNPVTTPDNTEIISKISQKIKEYNALDDYKKFEYREPYRKAIAEKRKPTFNWFEANL